MLPGCRCTVTSLAPCRCVLWARGPTKGAAQRTSLMRPAAARGADAAPLRARLLRRAAHHSVAPIASTRWLSRIPRPRGTKPGVKIGCRRAAPCSARPRAVRSPVGDRAGRQATRGAREAACMAPARLPLVFLSGEVNFQGPRIGADSFLCQRRSREWAQHVRHKPVRVLPRCRVPAATATREARRAVHALDWQLQSPPTRERFSGARGGSLPPCKKQAGGPCTPITRHLYARTWEVRARVGLPCVCPNRECQHVPCAPSLCNPKNQKW